MVFFGYYCYYGVVYWCGDVGVGQVGMGGVQFGFVIFDLCVVGLDLCVCGFQFGVGCVVFGM